MYNVFLVVPQTSQYLWFIGCVHTESVDRVHLTSPRPISVFFISSNNAIQKSPFLWRQKAQIVFHRSASLTYVSFKRRAVLLPRRWCIKTWVLYRVFLCGMARSYKDLRRDLKTKCPAIKHQNMIIL